MQNIYFHIVVYFTSIIFVCMYLCTMCMSVSFQRSKKIFFESLGTGITDNCETQYVCYEQKLGLLQEHTQLLVYFSSLSMNNYIRFYFSTISQEMKIL